MSSDAGSRVAEVRPRAQFEYGRLRAVRPVRHTRLTVDAVLHRFPRNQRPGVPKHVIETRPVVLQDTLPVSQNGNQHVHVCCQRARQLPRDRKFVGRFQRQDHHRRSIQLPLRPPTKHSFTPLLRLAVRDIRNYILEY